MSKENQNKKYDGQNRCRRCDKPLSDPNDIYGQRCAEIVGVGGKSQINILDDRESSLYNDLINLPSLNAKSEPRGSFTTKGKNYKNSFVRVKTEKPEEIKYNVITDVTALGEKFQVEYTVDNGVIRFPFEDNADYWSILWRGGGKHWQKPFAEDIVNPKATDVIEAVKEIWRYYKR